MITVNSVGFQRDIQRLQRYIAEVQEKHLRFACARALTDAAHAGLKVMQQKLPEVFDRPTPFTTNALYVDRAKRQDPIDRQRATVMLRDWAGKGTPASTYLKAEVLGGSRPFKKFEKRLNFGGALSQREFVIPGGAAILDPYGNWSSSQILQVLEHLRTFNEASAARTNVSKAKLAKLRKRGLLTKTPRGEAKYFIARSKADGRPLGIWNVLGRGVVVPVAFFAQHAPTYQKRLDFNGPTLEAAAKVFPPALIRHFEDALRTAH